MSGIFIDTSAFYALLDADDAGHPAVKTAWVQIVESDVLLVTTNYILVETCALLQGRIGIEAVKKFQEDVVPLLEVLWIDEMLHKASVSALMTAQKRNLSLVDCSSFEVMRQSGIRSALTLDRHFREQGFETLL